MERLCGDNAFHRIRRGSTWIACDLDVAETVKREVGLELFVAISIENVIIRRGGSAQVVCVEFSV